MKPDITPIYLAAIILCPNFLFGRGTFQNLGFEQANLIPLGPYTVAASNAIPGWNAYINGVTTSVIHYDDLSLGGEPWISIQDANGYMPVIQGNYTVLLQPDYDRIYQVAIGQTGTVPDTALSVIFLGTGAFTLTFADQQISLVTLGSTPTFSIFGGDISPFVNQTGELLFQGGGSLDNIFFSTQSIPEPRVLGLFGLGSLFLGWRFLREK